MKETFLSFNKKDKIINPQKVIYQASWIVIFDQLDFEEPKNQIC